MTHLTLSGMNVLITMGLLIASIFVAIILLKIYWKKQLPQQENRKESSLKNTGSLHAFGICLSLIASITLMSWTQSEKQSYEMTFIDTDEPMITLEIPRTIITEKKPKPIPPPSPDPIIIAVEDPEPIVEPKFIPEDIPENAVIVDSEPDVPYYPEPTVIQDLPPSKDDEFVDDTEFVIVEEMPRFPGCEEMEGTKDEKKACAEKLMMQYIAKNLKYPTIARENRVEGRVFVQFVVDKKGDITKIELIRDIGAGCGDAAISVIKNMVQNVGLWNPGLQRGRAVKVKYTLPINFILN